MLMLIFKFRMNHFSGDKREVRDRIHKSGGAKLHYSCANLEKLFVRNNKNGVKFFTNDEFFLFIMMNFSYLYGLHT